MFFYTRHGTTIAIAPIRISQSLDNRGGTDWVGIQKKVDGSYNFCGSNEIPCSIEKEHIRPSVTRSVMEMVLRI